MKKIVALTLLTVAMMSSTAFGFFGLFGWGNCCNYGNWGWGYGYPYSYGYNGCC